MDLTLTAPDTARIWIAPDGAELRQKGEVCTGGKATATLSLTTWIAESLRGTQFEVRIHAPDKPRPHTIWRVARGRVTEFLYDDEGR